MKLGLFYFSGTGNTKKILDLWTKSLEDNSISFDMLKIEDVSPKDIDLSIYDKIAFFYPIHAFNAPLIVLNFAKSIRRLDNELKCFLCMVSGEYLVMNNSSGNKLKRILKHKNIKVESDYHYIMPYNMIFRHSETNAYKMYETAKEIIPLHVKDYIVLNNIHKTRKFFLAGPILFLFRIEQIFAPINGKHFKVNMDKCIKCMKCVNSCPVKNIEFKDDKFVFSNKCLLCTRCSFNCPKDAFKIGLLNNWRVNKPYAFKMPNEKEIDKHKNFCKGSYKRYYKEADELVKSHS